MLTNVGVEILTSVVVKSNTFCDITSCNPLKFNNLSKKHVASIFTVEYAEQEASMEAASRESST